MSKDHYATLGIRRGATQDEVRSAFRELAKKYHPDRNRERRKWAEEKFKEISRAYEVLADPQKRRVYDAGGDDDLPARGPGREGATSRRAGPVGAEGFEWSQFTHFQDLEDLFDDDEFRRIFGDDTFRRVRTPFGRTQYADRGNDVTTSVTLSLEDLLEPRKLKLRYPRMARCERCLGSGSRSGSSLCPVCRGSGQVRETSDRSPRVIEIGSCPRCRGTGRHVAERCRECAGAGKKETEASLTVTVPAGAESGTKLRMAGQGDEGEHGAGDLLVEVRLRPHERFRREGADVVLPLHVSFPQAALGASAEVVSLDGRRLSVRLPRGVHHGTRLRLEGLGLPRPGGPRGDMFVEVQVRTPAVLSARETELYEELLGHEASRRERGRST